jgi:hypothetical protein
MSEPYIYADLTQIVRREGWSEHLIFVGKSRITFDKDLDKATIKGMRYAYESERPWGLTGRAVVVKSIDLMNGEHLYYLIDKKDWEKLMEKAKYESTT